MVTFFTSANFLHGQSDLGNADRKVTLLFDHDPMSLTAEERVEREKHRREHANARMREKVAAARKRGICRCGSEGVAFKEIDAPFSPAAPTPAAAS